MRNFLVHWLGGILLLAGWLIVFSPRVCADDSMDSLRALKIALQNVQREQADAQGKYAGSDNTNSTRTESHSDSWIGLLFNLRIALESDEPAALEGDGARHRGQAGGVDQIVQQIVSFYPSAEAVAACEELEKNFHRRQGEQQQARAAQIGAVLAAATQAVQSAREPADLDGTLRSLGDLVQRSKNLRLDDLSPESGKIESVRQFVLTWQDYLFGRRRSDLAGALQSLQIAAGPGAANVLPRSDILSRLADLEIVNQRLLASKQPTAESPRPSATPTPPSTIIECEEILTRAKTLDDIPATILALNNIRTESPANSVGSLYSQDWQFIQNLQSELADLGRIYNEYRAESPLRFDEHFLGAAPHNLNPLPLPILKLRAQLTRLLYARDLEVPDRLKPGPDEPLSTYYNRVMADAASRADARLMLRLQQLTGDPKFQESAGLSTFNGQLYNDSLKALRFLVAAQNQEEARQFLPAVISYEQALRSDPGVILTHAVGEHLDAIKAAHSDDYARGMQAFLATEPTR